MNRFFISMGIPPFDIPPDGTMEKIVVHSIYVEFNPNDALITEMCDGGGRSWVDLFLDWDLVLSSSGTVFGARSTKLVNPKLFENYLVRELSSYGNTGAWELYRQYAEAVYADVRFDRIPERKQERLAIWQKYLMDYQTRYPGRQVA